MLPWIRSIFGISQKHHSSTKETLWRLLKPAFNCSKMWFRYKYALNWSSSLLPFPSGSGMEWVGTAALKCSLLWDECLPVKQSHVPWDASSCLFFPGLFFQASAVACWVFFDTWNSTVRTCAVFQTNQQSKAKGPVAVTSGSCTKEFCLINVVLYSFFFLPGAISQRWLTRCRASFILEIFVLSMQRAQQMDLLALWGKNSCSLVLKTP